jgi:hypothetical protein
MEKKEQITCKNVFKTEPTALKSQFTQKWIELINQIEKNKNRYTNQR